MFRVGAVEYLNTKPLIYRLVERCPQIELHLDLPSRLADRLAARELDVALIPSVEYLQHDHYHIVSDAAIACRGPVRSVRLLSRVPMSQIRRLALDEGSRTSAVLAQCLLWHTHGLRPELVPFPIDAPPESIDADALLMIGDRAMFPPLGEYHEIWDLGDRWCRATERSFVFAMWVTSHDSIPEAIVTALSQTRDLGLAHVEEIAAREAGPHGLTVSECVQYFREHLYFRLGTHELNGLRHFAVQASQLGLVPPSCVDRIKIRMPAAKSVVQP